MHGDIAGIIRITNHWFEHDGPSVEKTFFLMKKNDQILYHPEFRDFWEDCIQPIYVSRRNNIQNITEFDFKTNPRRCHPFADSIYQWYLNVKRNVAAKLDHIPFLILKPSDLILPSHWRQGLCEFDYYHVIYNYKLNGNTILKRFQKRWKNYCNTKKKFNLCVQEIDNDVAYRFGKYKMEILMTRFYSNVEKLTR